MHVKRAFYCTLLSHRILCIIFKYVKLKPFVPEYILNSLTFSYLNLRLKQICPVENLCYAFLLNSSFRYHLIKIILAIYTESKILTSKNKCEDIRAYNLHCQTIVDISFWCRPSVKPCI